MSTQTMKELIEKATPGPWVPAAAGIYNDIIIRTPDVHNRIPRYEMVAEAWTKNGMPIEVAAANAQLIARCNPATMAKVVEALELACAYIQATYDDVTYDVLPELNAVKTALNLLNGKPTQ